MFEQLQKIILMLTAQGESRERISLGRRAALMAARFLSGSASRMDFAGFMDRVRFHEEELSSWVRFDEALEGKTGPFDACDLRQWLLLADKAGVPSVEAREILRLDQAEASLLSGKIDLFEGRAGEHLRRALTNTPSVSSEAIDPDTRKDAEDLARSLGMDQTVSDPDAVVEKTFAAMDDVPEGWMVRSARVGSSELKALAGLGIATSSAPEVRFGPDLEVGPGWVRNGNRRRVNLSDGRTVKALAEGPADAACFLARPWVTAARYFESDDPHRHGTQFAGKGLWPAEWRAFVEDGSVVGVSFYYAWAGEMTAENAEMALLVREEAQKIVDVASNSGMWPRLIDIEHARRDFGKSGQSNDRIEEQFRLLGRKTVSCTLDFIEAEDGLKLLEGGPAHSPFGGGHPCGFAGFGRGRLPARFVTEGVAFRSMPHILLGDHPGNWHDGDRTGCISTWDEVEALAMHPAPNP